MSEPTPMITFLEPSSVNQGWEGTIKIHGSGFDSGSFVLIDGKVPQSTFRGDALLEAKLTREITGIAGNKIVKVHTSGGAVSDEVTLTVRPISAS